MSHAEDFHVSYAAALRRFLEAGDEASLAVGHELGRRALQEQTSVLEIIENHFGLVDDLGETSRTDRSAALQFLLQTLAAVDVATRGFLDGTRRYEQQRARAEDLAERDEFRTALVNSLQEGFFVADGDRAVIEINDAFAEITGYPADGLPYRWPHPWVVDAAAADQRLAPLVRDGKVTDEMPIRHRDGHSTWVAISANTVRSRSARGRMYVGTIRDITAARASAARQRAVMRVATAVGVAKSVAEVLSVALEECATAIDVRRVVAVMWPTNGDQPTVQAVGEPAGSTWRQLDSIVRHTLHEARQWPPLTVRSVWCGDDHSTSRGIVAVLAGTGDVVLWFEHGAPRRVNADDQLLVTVLVGHLSLAVQHVRQFETARETSLTLQRAMLAPLEPPAGFASRYEPAVLPLEIGGDWYDVLSLGDHRIGIIVGDCVGRGLPAAAVMGQLRSAARALMLTGAEPALVLEGLDSAAALIPDALCTTVLVGIIDSDTATLRYSSAGHLPAVLHTPQSGAALLTDARSVPLAVRRDDPRPQASQVLPPGSTLALFTDGLVERRGEPIDDGIARVGEVLASAAHMPVDGVADRVLRELAPAAGYDDDVAIVVHRRIQAPLRIETEATADRLKDVRHGLRAWLRSAAVPDPLAMDIVLAVNEACTNSMEHAYRGHRHGTMRVEAQTDGLALHLRVIDSGCWKPSPADPGSRGRGLPLIRAVSDRVEVNATPAGTTVEMRIAMPATV